MTTFKKTSALFTAIFSLILIAGINLSVAQSGSVVDVINESDDHTILAELLETTELDNVIAQQGPFTVVAPTDDAFEDMGSELEQLRQDPERAQNVVIGHLFQGEVPAEEAEPELNIEITNGDIPATNGLVHVTESVIMN
ncbi:fasciclin domain-containing protein [Rhodohalobacter halophilus]|uniref:fasciclin domain-containing protein n=1 Tax=Rhodohalobacter halophilus TaxID=1812810 RepID=UPI00083FBCCF|nr:fasciclin domain-containing protein [Rhodohalobacter halophilus]